jgi:uncharacterized protein YcnI
LSLLSAWTVLGGITWAHVTVSPDISDTGERETYSFRVPNEKESTRTVKVEVMIPSGLDRIYFESIPGWKLTLDKDNSGQVIRATWTGGSVGPWEYVIFRCMVRNPQASSKLVWKTVQYYADGSKDEWTGEQGSRRPAPTTTVASP